MLLCSLTTDTIHNPTTWSLDEEWQEQKHQAGVEPDKLKKPENAQKTQLSTQYAPAQHIQHAHYFTHAQHTTLRAPWMTSRRRYNPNKKKPLSPLLSQLIQRLYSLHSPLHCNDGDGGSCLIATASQFEQRKVTLQDRGEGALEVYGLPKSLSFNDRIESRPDLIDGWVDASSSGSDSCGELGRGMSISDEDDDSNDGERHDDDDDDDDDDGNDDDEALLDWGCDTSSAGGDPRRTHHTMNLRLRQPCALNGNPNANTNTNGSAQARVYKGEYADDSTAAAFLSDKSTTISILTTDSNPHSAISPSIGGMEQPPTSMPFLHPLTSDSGNEDDDILCLPPPTPRPRFIELSDTDVNGNAEADAKADDNDTDTDSKNSTCWNSASLPPAAGSSSLSSFPSSPEVHSHSHPHLPPLTDWKMHKQIEQQDLSSFPYHSAGLGHDSNNCSTPAIAIMTSTTSSSLSTGKKEVTPALFFSETNDSFSPWWHHYYIQKGRKTVNPAIIDVNSEDAKPRPRTAHGLRRRCGPDSSIPPKHDDDNDVLCAPSNEHEPPGAPRLGVLSGDFDYEDEEEEGLNFEGEYEYHYDPNAIYLYDPFDLHPSPDSRRNEGDCDGHRDDHNIISLQSHSKLPLSSPTSTFTSLSTSTSLSLSTSPATSTSSPTNPLFPSDLPRPSPSSPLKKLKPSTSPYGLSEKSQWKLAVARYQRSLSTRGLRHPGFPPSPLGPNWEKYYGRA